MDLDKDIEIELKGIIIDKIENTYNMYVNEIDVSFFVNDIIVDTKVDISGFMEISDELIVAVENRINKTKYRWYKKEVSKRVNLENEIEVIAKGLYKMGDNQKFKMIYNVDTPEELRTLRLKELEDWSKDKSKLLSDFIYLGSKMKYQIRLALINDAKCIALKYLKEQSSHAKKSYIINMPQSMSNIPIDYTNRASINIKKATDINIVSKGDKKYFVDKYYIDKDTVFETLVDAEILKIETIKDFMGTLNELDIMVFSYLLSLADESFYSTREIVTSVSDIVKYCRNSDGIKNYIAIKESLFKMQYLTSGVIDSSLRGFTLKILDNVDIYKVDNKEMVKVLFNVDIINQLVKAKTIRMYKNVIDNFKLSSSKMLIFRLQKERVALSLKDSENLTMKVNMNFFRGVLYFSDKKKHRNIKVVENSLREIVENKITLKDFKRNGENFVLDFYPITDRERLDLLRQLK